MKIWLVTANNRTIAAFTSEKDAKRAVELCPQLEIEEPIYVYSEFDCFAKFEL